VERVNSLAALMKGTVLFFQCYCAGMFFCEMENLITEHCGQSVGVGLGGLVFI